MSPVRTYLLKGPFSQSQTQHNEVRPNIMKLHPEKPTLSECIYSQVEARNCIRLRNKGGSFRDDDLYWCQARPTTQFSLFISNFATSSSRLLI